MYCFDFKAQKVKIDFEKLKKNVSNTIQTPSVTNIRIIDDIRFL